jgi:hypothetical protein
MFFAIGFLKPKKGKQKLNTRKLGSLEVSELGFGNMGLSGGHYGPGVDKAQGIRVIRDARACRSGSPRIDWKILPGPQGNRLVAQRADFLRQKQKPRFDPIARPSVSQIPSG